MARNGSGTYIAPAGNPVVTGTVIQSTQFNSTVADIGAELTNSLPRDGQAPMSAGLKLIDGGVTVPAITFNSESNTGLYRPIAGNIAVTAGGVENIRFNSSGRVLIGTTTDDGVSRLQITGPVAVTGTVTASNFVGNASSATNVVGTVGIANGGTGATTVAQAKINLNIATSATGSAVISAGTTAQRDGSPGAGYFRFNSSFNQFEGYNGTVWGAVGGGATGTGSDTVFYENNTTVTASYSLTAGKNAHLVGPLNLNSGVVLTVGTGQRLVIL